MSVKDFPLEIRVLAYLLILDLVSIPFVFFLSSSFTSDLKMRVIIIGVQLSIAVLLYVIGWTLGRQTVELKDPRLKLWDTAGEDLHKNEEKKEK